MNSQILLCVDMLSVSSSRRGRVVPCDAAQPENGLPVAGEAAKGGKHALCHLRRPSSRRGERRRLFIFFVK